MDLKSYFENAEGFGVLSTADKDGNVNAAVYSRPHFMEDGTLAFIMRERLTHHNLQSNDKAIYLFREEAPGYKGKRLYLTKTGEEKETERLYELRRRTYPPEKDSAESKYLVFFRLEEALPLVGSGGKGMEA